MKHIKVFFTFVTFRQSLNDHRILRRSLVKRGNWLIDYWIHGRHNSFTVIATHEDLQFNVESEPRMATAFASPQSRDSPN